MPSYFHSMHSTTSETNTNFDARTSERKRASIGECSAPPDIPPDWWPPSTDMEMHLYKMMASQLQMGTGDQQAALRMSRSRSPARTSTFPRIIDVLPRIETPARRSLHQRQRSRSVGRWPSFNDIRRLHAGRTGHVCGLADNSHRFSPESSNSLVDACSCMQVQRYPGLSCNGNPPAPPPSVVEDSLAADTPTDRYVVIPCGSSEDEFADDTSDFFITETKDDRQPKKECIGQSKKKATAESSNTEISALARYNMMDTGKQYISHLYARIPSSKTASYQQRAAFNPYRPVRVRHHETTSPSVRLTYAKTPTPWSPISTMLLEHSITSARE